ncbi:MAG TPA: O-methyltransferase [Nocardioidaceae bacterium]|nr:O-methyltransferase [Nocardioidaceae bacterium]
MGKSEWAAVDDYIVAELQTEDEAVRAVHAANADAGLPTIDVSAPQGKQLELLAAIAGAGRVLEIGTLGGYSTIWLARGVGPQGSVTTCEVDQHHADVARANLDRAGVGDRVEIRVGPALESLAALESEHAEAFDFVFIDADKVNNGNYLRWALRLGRPGTVVVVDNVVRGGSLADPGKTDDATEGSREVLALIAAEPRLDGTVVQTVGSKGWDGFALARIVR